MSIWDLRKKMNDIKKQIHDLSMHAASAVNQNYLFFTDTQHVLGEKNV